MAFSPILGAVGGAHTVTSTAQTIAAATGLTVPGNANWAEGTVRTGSLTYSSGSFTPTASLGKQVNVQGLIRLRSREEIINALFIRVGGSDVQIDWDFYSV